MPYFVRGVPRHGESRDDGAGGMLRVLDPAARHDRRRAVGSRRGRRAATRSRLLVRQAGREAPSLQDGRPREEAHEVPRRGPPPSRKGVQASRIQGADLPAEETSSEGEGEGGAGAWWGTRAPGRALERDRNAYRADGCATARRSPCRRGSPGLLAGPFMRPPLGVTASGTASTISRPGAPHPRHVTVSRAIVSPRKRCRRITVVSETPIVPSESASPAAAHSSGCFQKR